MRIWSSRPGRRTAAALLAATALVLAGCGGSDDDDGQPQPQACAATALPSGAASTSFAVAGWSDRDYDLLVPASHVCGQPIAVVLSLHGGGGNRTKGRKTTCPDGDVSSPGCIEQVAMRAGMAVVFADGTKIPGSDLLTAGGLRTWNAGGGTGGYNCVSGNACANVIDDIAYIRALLASIGGHVTVDPKRVFATGFSNGAAMAQRLACQADDLFAAVVPVSGENQFALVNGGCTPTRPVAVLDIHGTADSCWPYAGGNGGCLETGLYVSVAATLADWSARNGCAASASTTLPPVAPADGTSIVRQSYAGCAAGGELQHLQVIGGGHFWPGGNMESVAPDPGGVPSRQLDASAAAIDWFVAHARP